MKKIQIQLFDFLVKNKEIYPLFFRKAEQSLESLLRYVLIQKIIYKILFWNVKKKKYLVFGLKHKDIIESLPKNETVVLGGGKTTLSYCLKNTVSSLFIYHYFKYLLPFSEKVKYNSPVLINAIDRLSHALNKTGAKYLILETDSLPAQRMLVAAARKVNIKSICILDGITSSKVSKTLYDGYFCDYIFVYTEYQKKLLANAGIEKSKILIFGFWYSIPDIFPLILNRQDICVLGQPWKEYDADKFNNYFVSLEWTFKELFKHGFNVIYKPHPAEKDLSYIYEISEDVIVDRSDIKSCLMKYDVFVSNASTALLEATLHGKLAVQIYTGNLFDDKLEENYYAYTVDIFDDVLLLKHLKNSYPIEPTELIEMTRIPLEVRFKEILSRLDNQK